MVMQILQGIIDVRGYNQPACQVTGDFHIVNTSFIPDFFLKKLDYISGL